MHSYQTLAVLALAVSTASPALSAPVLDSEQARDVGSDFLNILNEIKKGNFAGSRPVQVLGAEDSLDGNSTRRALPRDTHTTREDPLVERATVDGILDDVVDKFKAIFNGTGLGRREPSPFDLGNITATVENSLKSLGSLDDVVVNKLKGILGLGGDTTRRDFIDGLQFIGRRLNELD